MNARLIVTLLPVLSTPVLGLLMIYDFVNFGGGDADMVVLIPWLFWSLCYAVLCLISWHRGLSVEGGLTYGFGGATIIVAAVYVAGLTWF